MRGTRYGDFSRPLLGAEASTRRQVLLQQGRVQLDSDWNAQSDLITTQLTGALSELLGHGAVVTARSGFEVQPTIALCFGGRGRVEAQLPGSDEPTTHPATLELDASWSGRAGTLFEVSGQAQPRLRLSCGKDGRLHLSRRWPGAPRSEGQLVTSESLPVGRFVRLAVVDTGGPVALYVDGRLLGEGAFPEAEPSGPWGLSIGGPAGQGSGFHGLLRDVRVWSTPRTAAELAAPAPEPDHAAPGLLARWILGDGHGDVAHPSVGSHSARLVGTEPPTWRLCELEVRPGYLWADGLRVELLHPLRYTAQSPHPGLVLPQRPGRSLVYLETWERSVSALEDPSLAEVALNGQDTSIRTQLVTAVRRVELPGGDQNAGRAGTEGTGASSAGEDLDADSAYRWLETLLPEPTGRIQARHAGGDPAGNYLYRIEIHESGDTESAAGRTAEVPAAVFDPAAGVLAVTGDWPAEWAAGCEIVLVASDTEGRQTLERRVVAEVMVTDDDPRVRLVGDLRGARGHGSYRVRGPSPSPTFKWSRRNAADLLAVGGLHPDGATAEILASSALTEVAAGTVAEWVVGDADPSGPAHPLLVIEDVAADQRSVTFAGPVGHAPVQDRRGVLRLWDHTPPAGRGETGALPVRTAAWTPLEYGVEISFEPGTYRRGDYWWVLTRQDHGVVGWPARHGRAAPAKPAGVERHRAPLALVEIKPDRVSVHDLRLARERTGGDELLPVAAPSANAEPGAGALPVPAAPASTGPLLPAGFAVIGPPGPAPDGFRATGAQVAVRSQWRVPVTIDWPGGPVEHALTVDGNLIVVTAQALWSLDLDSAAVEQIAEVPQPRHGAGCAVLGSTVYLVGGSEDETDTPSNLLGYDIAAGTWRSGPALRAP